MVQALLDFSHQSGIYDFMHSTWGWPAVETLHFMGLSLLIGTVGLFDLPMMGLARGISMSALHRLVPWGVAGYVLNVMTGVMFVTSAQTSICSIQLFRPSWRLWESLESTCCSSIDSCSARSSVPAPVPAHHGQPKLRRRFR